MRTLFRIGLVGLALAFILNVPTWGQPREGVLQSGAATIDITPKQPVPMSGYADRDQPSKGVHDNIAARAIVMDDGAQRACLIQADLIGFSHDFADEVRLGVEKQTGIPRSNVLLAAVHNHGGPSTSVYGESVTDNLTAYLTDLKKNLIEVAVRANKNKVPVSMGFGKGVCNMNINRRARQADGGIWLGRNPDGPCDRDVDVVRFDNSHSEPVALFVNWPCHATVDGQENSLITGDWPGAAARYLDAHFKSGLPVAITAGASGNINPIYGPNNNFGDIEAIGLILGEEIVDVARAIRPNPTTGIAVRYKEVEVPGKERSASRKPGEAIVPGKPVKLRFTVLKVGPVVFAGISGELMTEIGMTIKDESPFSRTIIVTHCNGSSGYLVTDKAYEEGGYEPMVSRTMPGTEKIIVETFGELLGSL